MDKNQEVKKILARCKEDYIYFCEKFIKISHPLVGIIPFKLFKYQRRALKEIENNRFVIFKKPRQCFEAETPILTVNGIKPIKDIQKNELIWSFSIEKNRIYAAKVANIFKRPNQEQKPSIRIQTNNHKVICTSDHRYLTTKGWKEAGKLTKNDCIIQIDRKLQPYKNKITSVEKINPIEYLYDLEVPPFNNFIADNAVVHNSGLSTLTGTYALWLAMFNNYKTILIVSRTDNDSKDFLKRNIRIPYSYLPEAIKKIWRKPEPDNEHQLGFRNGSVIKSLTSNKEVIRSNAASFIIVDEAAFMRDMEDMWGAGYPSLTHGGKCAVVSTSGAINNWYWRAWQDAINKKGIFHPIDIQWWDMDWCIEKGNVKIAPTEGIKECKTPEEIEMYGKYTSSWLKEQRMALLDGNDDSRFKRECLTHFIGIGKSVINQSVITYYQEKTVEDPIKKIGMVEYTQPQTGEVLTLDFQDKLWIWRFPKKQDKLSKIPITNEMFVLGSDIATGEGIDMSTITVIDAITREQVAEWQGYIRPKMLAYMIDYIGRMYNNAMAVVERSGIGYDTVKELYQDLNYPNMYMEKRRNAIMAHVKRKQLMPGFSTTESSKLLLVKTLKDNLGENGYIIKSTRMLEELSIFSHLNRNKIGAEPGKGNHDDLVISLGLALYGCKDALLNDPRYFTFCSNNDDFIIPEENKVIEKVEHNKREIIAQTLDKENFMYNVQDEQDKFCLQLGSMQTMTKQTKVVSNVLKDKVNRLKYKRL
jgi:hypothetical protein